MQPRCVRERTTQHLFLINVIFVSRAFQAGLCVFFIAHLVLAHEKQHWEVFAHCYIAGTRLSGTGTAWKRPELSCQYRCGQSGRNNVEVATTSLS